MYMHYLILHYVYIILLPDALYLFHHPVVDVSAQGGCTITPINPTTLTAAGGVLLSGTENVMIQCNNCTNDDGGTLGRVRWYDPDGNRLLRPVNNAYVPGAPYYARVNYANNDIILVIPTFNDSYDGMYTCGERAEKGQLPGLPNAVVILTIDGK